MDRLFGWLTPGPDPDELRLSQLIDAREAARAERDDAFNSMKSARIELNGASSTIDDLREDLDATDRAMREALLSGR